MRDHQLTQVSLVVAPQTSLMTLAAVIDPLRAANRLARSPVFEWHLWGLDQNAIELTSGIEIATEGALGPDMVGDMLCVVAGFDHERLATARNLSHLASTASRFQTVCGIEAGTWLLAKAGVLTDHRVTTHWEDIEALQLAYPSLEVRRDRYTVDRKIWTSGGAAPSLDMMLHFVRTLKNPLLAQDVASAFVYPDSQSATEAQITSPGARFRSIEPRLAEAIDIMVANIEDPLSIKDISSALSISNKTLELLFNKHLQTAPKQMYIRLRLQAARKLIVNSAHSLTHIAIRSGFASASHFSRAFRQYYGVAPRTLRGR